MPPRDRRASIRKGKKIPKPKEKRTIEQDNKGIICSNSSKPKKKKTHDLLKIIVKTKLKLGGLIIIGIKLCENVFFSGKYKQIVVSR